MSGVVDGNGQQWEHCYECGKLVRIQDLEYTSPTKDHPFGSQMCPECYDEACEGLVPNHDEGWI